MSEERKEQYKSLLIICAGFALIGWRFHLWYLVGLATLILIIGLISSALLVMITDAWMWIGEKIGAVMSRVILSFIFVFALTPIALLYRAFSGRTKRLKKETYFVERNHTYIATDLEKIF